MTPAQNAIETIRACLGRAFPERLEMAAFAADAIERARVVGVLDAWADKSLLNAVVIERTFPVERPFYWTCRLGTKFWEAATADAARAAAAKAIEAGEV